MRVEALWRDEEAVSEVIGVVLLVGVAVIVATTITVFVFGIGESVSDVGPTASFEFESNYFGDGVPKNDSVTLVHASGDSLPQENVRVQIGTDEVFNGSRVTDRGPTTVTLEGLIVEIDDDRFNDLNKGEKPSGAPADGPPGDGDGDSPNVVNEWTDTISAGDRLVIQERNAGRAIDVIEQGEPIRVVWMGEDESYVLSEGTVAPGREDSP